MLNQIDKMRESRFCRALFAVVLIIGLCLPSALLGVRQAEAASTVYLRNSGASATYGGYSTTKCYVDGKPAYCAQPSKATPSSGTYSTSKITTQPGGGVQHDPSTICKTLYFGYGGPGFDPSMWPSTWYDGTAWTADRYFAVTHIIISDFYSNDAGAALAGCNSSFRNWVYGNILAYDGHGGYVDSALQNKFSWSDIPSWFYDLCFQVNTAGGVQTMVSYSELGWIGVQKESANPELTDGNDCYSLEGAEYTIYKTESDASNNENSVGKLTTNDKGYGASDWLELGTYWIKETKAPEGYALDNEPIKVQVNEVAKATKVIVEEEPQADPVSVLLGKYDGNRTYNGESNITQAGAPSLEGAEFTFKFYPTLEEDYESVEPLRTWVLKTDSDGFTGLWDEFKISGDNFFYEADGVPTLPIGTLTVQETKAPEGYKVDEKVHVRQITPEGVLETINTYNMPLIPEIIKKGGISIEKRDFETNGLTPQGGASLDGTQFAIVNENDKGAFVDREWCCCYQRSDASLW